MHGKTAAAQDPRELQRPQPELLGNLKAVAEELSRKQSQRYEGGSEPCRSARPLGRSQLPSSQQATLEPCGRIGEEGGLDPVKDSIGQIFQRRLNLSGS